MTSSTILVEWSELIEHPLEDDLIDLWIAVQNQHGVDAKALSATALAYQAAYPDRAVRIVDVVSEVDAIHDVDVGATIMALTKSKTLDEWAPSIRHNQARVSQLTALHNHGHTIGIVSESVWSRSWTQQFLDRDQVPYDGLFVANEGNWRLNYPDAWGDAITRLGHGIAICTDERKVAGAHATGLKVHPWTWIDAQTAHFTT